MESSVPSIFMKKCSKCGISKTVDQFAKGNRCRQCFNGSAREYRRKNKRKAEPRDSTTIYECSKCKVKKSGSEFRPGRADCRPCERQRCKDYKSQNKEKVSEYNRKYKEEHKEEVRKYDNWDGKQRRAIDIEFRMLSIMRSRVSNVTVAILNATLPET
jgi:hypothetical protein